MNLTALLRETLQEVVEAGDPESSAQAASIIAFNDGYETYLRQEAETKQVLLNMGYRPSQKIERTNL